MKHTLLCLILTICVSACGKPQNAPTPSAVSAQVCSINPSYSGSVVNSDCCLNPQLTCQCKNGQALAPDGSGRYVSAVYCSTNPAKLASE